ncbi:alpha-ketoglutarate-dependent dioxygenase AlkB family protein [Litchfieldella xinjiangensis]|uniref:alpha-ketoglutarate-dependent dioxygenase AlkB family protein n=1 Tax=Litchfieldella xinjiangensis TaxID=1166948 RepID=UPI00069411FF|nr:alpha-ketoglutarate-dependent dioxygenase AlkB [Halomonas xinjiangensis]
MSDVFHTSCERLLQAPPLWLCQDLLGWHESRALLNYLDQTLDWKQPSLRLYGREHPIPRRQVWMGDSNATYRYSGKEFQPAPWLPALIPVRERVEARIAALGFPARFNSILLNRYADGEERMGWHSDDEPELGPEPIVVALSLGAERPLRLRWRDRRSEAFNVWLPNDSLLLMGPGTQQQLQHALLPRRVPGLRISLTFRYVS